MAKPLPWAAKQAPVRMTHLSPDGDCSLVEQSASLQLSSTDGIKPHSDNPESFDAAKCIESRRMTLDEGSGRLHPDINGVIGHWYWIRIQPSGKKHCHGCNMATGRAHYER